MKYMCLFLIFWPLTEEVNALVNLPAKYFKIPLEIKSFILDIF